MRRDSTKARRAARSAYEIGRLRAACLRAGGVTAIGATFATSLWGAEALAWLPVTPLAWTLVEWRGAWVARGARAGLLGGAVVLTMPESCLRPCTCVAIEEAARSCCAVPHACAVVTAFVGLSLAVLLPGAPQARRAELAVGTALGAIAVAALRCGTLTGVETAELVLGLLGGIVAASFVRMWVDRRAAST